MAIAAVITGDIVNSTFIPKAQRKKLLSSIESILQPTQFEFYRGDSFQAYIKDVQQSLNLTLRIRLSAKKLPPILPKLSADVRIGIGVGKVQLPVRILNTNPDEVFVLSGHSLDDLTSTTDRLKITSADDKANCVFRVISFYTDFLLHQITSKQAAVLLELVQGLTQTETAKKLKKSQVTINKQAHAAGWLEMERILLEFKYAISQFNLK